MSPFVRLLSRRPSWCSAKCRARPREIKSAQWVAYGTRLEIKMIYASPSPADVLIEFTAESKTACRPRNPGLTARARRTRTLNPPPEPFPDGSLAATRSRTTIFTYLSNLPWLSLCSVCSRMLGFAAGCERLGIAIITWLLGTAVVSVWRSGDDGDKEGDEDQGANRVVFLEHHDMQSKFFLRHLRHPHYPPISFPKETKTN